MVEKLEFREAVKKVITSFVSNEDYDAFINGNQLQIETVGELIEDIYIDDKIMYLIQVGRDMGIYVIFISRNIKKVSRIKEW